MCYSVSEVKNCTAFFIPAHFKFVEINAKLSSRLYISEILISNWIYKSSSLPVLDRFSKSDDDPFRLTLLPEDVNSSLDNRVHSEKQAMEMGITSTKRSHGLTPSEKKTLVAKRLTLWFLPCWC